MISIPAHVSSSQILPSHIDLKFDAFVCPAFGRIRV
jgi:hypothetical protein